MTSSRLAPLIVLAAGVAAGMQVGKLPPALATLKLEFGLSLVQASLFVTLFQVAGAAVGIVGGMLADHFGARKVMGVGLGILFVAGVGSTLIPGAGAVLVFRAIESAGFILTVLPGPGLLRRVVGPEKLSRWLGLWAMYMPLGMGLMMLVGPLLVNHGGWRLAWWFAASAVLVPLVLVGLVPADSRSSSISGRSTWREPVIATVSRLGPWSLALGFGCYAAQWMAVFTFLPLIYQQAGLVPASAGLLSAIAVLVNIVGNGAAGAASRCLPAAWVIAGTAIIMGICAFIGFGGVEGLTFTMRYGAILVFSAVGGLVPGCLFIMSARLAASPASVSTTVGLMQQGSAIGQGLGPPLVAQVAAHSQAWTNSWMAIWMFGLGLIVAALVMQYAQRRH